MPRVMVTAESPWLFERRGPRSHLGPARYAAQPWVSEAACRGRGSLFFGPAGERPEPRLEREGQARLVCAGCPVLEPCRRWAREQREYGFWGGESEEERVAAGFPVAMPIGRVAKTIQTLRAAAKGRGGPGQRYAMSRSSRTAPVRHDPGLGQEDGGGDPADQGQQGLLRRHAGDGRDHESSSFENSATPRATWSAQPLAGSALSYSSCHLHQE